MLGSNATFTVPVDCHLESICVVNRRTDELLQANLIMPEPCPFLDRNFPICSIVRPTETKGAAMGALNALTRGRTFHRSDFRIHAAVKGFGYGRGCGWTRIRLGLRGSTIQEG